MIIQALALSGQRLEDRERRMEFREQFTALYPLVSTLYILEE